LEATECYGNIGKDAFNLNKLKAVKTNGLQREVLQDHERLAAGKAYNIFLFL